jgi:hypothetical protein
VLGAFRPLADPARIRLLSGLPRGEAGRYDPLIAENRKIVGVAEAKNGDQYAAGGRRSRPDRGANRAVTAASTTRRQRNWLKGEQ